MRALLYNYMSNNDKNKDDDDDNFDDTENVEYNGE